MRMDERYYLLKIQLLEIEPAIWRRFVVPSNISLDRLHDVIQIVMGWTDSHLHEFTIGKKRYTEYPESKEDGLIDGMYRLGDLIKQKGRSFQYWYDFGDDWMHEVILEDNKYFNPHQRSQVVCLDGSRACPPDDVGGPYGYGEYLEAMKDPNHEEHTMYIEWRGPDFDSETFDLGFINFQLDTFLRWSRERYKS